MTIICFFLCFLQLSSFVVSLKIPPNFKHISRELLHTIHKFKLCQPHQQTAIQHSGKWTPPASNLKLLVLDAEQNCCVVKIYLMNDKSTHFIIAERKFLGIFTIFRVLRKQNSIRKFAEKISLAKLESKLCKCIQKCLRTAVSPSKTFKMFGWTEMIQTTDFIWINFKIHYSGEKSRENGWKMFGNSFSFETETFWSFWWSVSVIN